MKLTICATACFMFICFYGFCQSTTPNDPELAFGEGSIMLNDGTELKGLVRYNSKTGVLTYENGTVSGSYLSRNVIAFEFFDDQKNLQRVFYSLEYEDPSNSVKRWLFFEVVKEFGNFAVLSKNDPLTAKSDPGAWYFDQTYPDQQINRRVVYQQVETIYFMNGAGEIKPYLRVKNKMIDNTAWFDRNSSREKIVDKDLLEEFTGVHYPQIKKFIKDNQLFLDYKEDLLRVLDYYSELIGQ